ncbi:MAG: DUF5678 domain-containing protein [Planctomycetota bacterium]|nr:DUF5678 domain-containing protein [Planctomycetota bacterium]
MARKKEKSKTKSKKKTKKKSRKARQLTGYDLARQSCDFLSRNFMKFVEKYPGEYVYALGNRVIAHGDDLDAVNDEALEKAGDRDRARGLVLQCIPETVEDAGMIL